MKTILLKIDNQGLHYHPQQYIPWTATNMPVGDFLFRTNEPIFWRAALLAYEPIQQALQLEILEYDASYEEAFEQQHPKRPIQRIELAPLDEQQFKALLSYYKPASISKILAKNDAQQQEPQSVVIDWGQSLPPQKYPILAIENIEKKEEAFLPPKDQMIPLLFNTSMMEATFSLGLVTVYTYCLELDTEVSLPIYNDFIIPEFDYIKPYFAQVLKQRKFPVNGQITVKDGAIVSRSARAPVIEKIDENFLELVRAARLEDVLKKPKIEVLDKSLFTADEMFNTFSETAEAGNVFGTPDEDILRQILELRKVRNVKQLHYLAGKLHDSIEKIRFTLSPLFGFIFIMKGKLCNHFIWELLNSHATYVWSYEKDGSQIERQFSELEKILHFIRINGRQEYRNNYHLTHNFTFHAIRHKDANSKLVDGFPRWRNQLLEKLI
jgi:hypothetical protein